LYFGKQDKLTSLYGAVLDDEHYVMFYYNTLFVMMYY